MQVLSGEDGAIGGEYCATIGTVFELFDRCRDTLCTSLFGFAHCLTPRTPPVTVRVMFILFDC